MIDSHVHLFTASQLEQLAWMTPDNVLYACHGPEQYAAASKSSAVDGYLVVEADWRHTTTDFCGPLEEFKYYASLIHSAHQPPIKALIPWAPLPWGSETVASFLAAMENADQAVYKSHVRGVRFLVQDLESGSMSSFTNAMKLLAERGLVADVGVKVRGAKPGPSPVYQVEEALEMVKSSPETRYVFDHLCKPDLQIPNNDLESNEIFKGYGRVMRQLAKYDTYIKLSGGFSELLPSVALSSEADVAEAIFPWVKVVFSAFGARRVMFGSDWPVSTIAGGSNAILRWKTVCKLLLGRFALSDDECESVWTATALKAYNIC
ncbi:uncharacterized protein V2V93DRAFT_380058 [Kockiozyma suomiensis]|uniref:uncharacterized protein n=1 Tax=Kockiozyma suomiensis TaxID=1337062 RepID=UPI0033435DD2